jgi:integrase
MGVKKYRTRQGTAWEVDQWITLPTGRQHRFRQRKIPTKEQAQVLLAKVKSEAFEGRFLDRRKEPQWTVSQLWERFTQAARRGRHSFSTEEHRGGHLKRHLGNQVAMHLTVEDIDWYREERSEEETVRGGPPSPASRNREVALLRRMLNWAVEAKLLTFNPIPKVSMEDEKNVRWVMVEEKTFAGLLEVAEQPLRPIILTAYDTGMRRGEILMLRWPHVDLRSGVIRLQAQDTKTNEARVIVLTERLVEELHGLPRDIRSDYVFVNPETGAAWNDIRKMWRRACKAAGLTGVWFHDLRRSFITNARRRGIPESVVMKMSGHKTRAVFERYNIVEEEDLRVAIRRLEAGAKAELGDQFGQDLDKVGSVGCAHNKAPSANH